MVIAQIGNAFACRTIKAHNTQMGWLSNTALLGGIAVSIVIILGLIYIPPLELAFDNRVFPSILWGVLILYGLVLYTLEWVRKSIARWSDKTRRPHSSESAERR